jgi:uncharacterized protein (PEP-CTERM system associated)
LSFPLAAPVAMLAALFAPHARADLKVAPAVTLRETYTDNVNLDADEFARSQFITELTPSLALTSNSPRLKLRAVASAHLYAYSDNEVEGLNRYSRDLSATALAKLIDDLLFFDGTASIGQHSVSAFGPQPNNNGYTDTNRTEVRTYQLSPYLKHSFGSTALGELRYTRDSVTSGEAALGNSIGNTVSLSLASGPSFRTVGWGLQASRQDLDDSLGRGVRSETSNANLRVRISNTFNLTATGGYDKYDYQGLGGTTAGNNYSLGFNWAPSSRTNVTANAGRRFFGKTYLLNAMHRSRFSVWSINYNDAVTTTREQFLLPATIDTAALLDRLFSTSISDPIARQQAVDAYIRANGLPPSLADSINYLSNRFMLQKQFQASAAFNGARTTGIVSVNATKRTALSTQQSDSALLGSSLFNLNDDTRQIGATVAVNYRLSPRSDLKLSINKNRTESLSNGLKGNQTLLSLSMTQQLQRKLSGSVELRRNQGDGFVQSGRPYQENAISASLSLQL